MMIKTTMINKNYDQNNNVKKNDGSSTPGGESPDCQLKLNPYHQYTKNQSSEHLFQKGSTSPSFLEFF